MISLRALPAVALAATLLVPLPLLLAQTGPGQVLSETKISSLTGGFGGVVGENDWFGAALDVLGDVNGDGVDDLAVGTRNANGGASDAGAVWILFMAADGTVSDQQKIDATEGGLGPVLAESDFFGEDVAGLGDLDGDGVPDLAVGAPGDDGTCTGSPFCGQGSLYILFLNADGTVKSHVRHDAAAAPFSNTDDVRLAEGLAFLGDLGGDGLPELAVGAPRWTDPNGPLQGGAVFICSLASDGSIVASSAILDTPPVGLQPADGFGASLAALGDLDDDGVTDLAVGTPGQPGPFDEGGVFVVRLLADGSAKGFTLISEGHGGFPDLLELADQFGSDVEGVGDLDGNGVPDLAVGMARDDEGGSSGLLSETGTVYVLFLDPTGLVQGTQRINRLEGNLSAPLVDRDFFGAGLASLGDPDGTGCVRLVVGAIGDDDLDSDFGALYLLDLRPGSFAALGGGLAGVAGVPSLTGTGTLTDNAPFSVTLSDAAPASTAWLVIGFSSLYAPLKGGTLVPAADLLVSGLPTGSGSLVVPGTWPAGVPAGLRTYVQFWIQDPVGPQGLSASHGLVATSDGP